MSIQWNIIQPEKEKEVLIHIMACMSLESTVWSEWCLIQKNKYCMVSFIYFLNIYIFFRGGREGERERNINVWLPLTRPLLGTWPTTHTCALTGSQTRNPLVHSPVLNPLSHTSQGTWFHPCEMCQIGKCTEIESSLLVVAGDREKKVWGVSLNGYRIFLQGSYKNVLKSDNGDGCKTVCVLKTP